jgi:hypothetical protein
MTAVIPLIAGGSLALTEIAFSFARNAEDATSHILSRLAWAAGAGLGGTVASALVLLAATPHVARSLLLTVGGTAAAVIVVAILSEAWRR